MPEPTRDAAGAVVVRSRPPALTAEIEAGGHRLRSDAARAIGGGETGPSPHELLLGAFGA